MSRPGEIDLHGLRPDDALRKLAQGLHTARVQGSRSLLVITGRGCGNLLQQPILRKRVESWLQSAEGRRAGAGPYRIVARGGALELEIGESISP